MIHHIQNISRYINSSTVSRFTSRIQKTETCWLFTNPKGGKSNKYGRFWISGINKNIVASRFSYELFVGSIPDEKLICHRCDNPPCVNPDHLFPGTDLDNLMDSLSKGRTRPIGKRVQPWNKFITHCHNGHEFTKENTVIRQGKWRQCLSCRRVYERERMRQVRKRIKEQKVQEKLL